MQVTVTLNLLWIINKTAQACLVGAVAMIVWALFETGDPLAITIAALWLVVLQMTIVLGVLPDLPQPRSAVSGTGKELKPKGSVGDFTVGGFKMEG